MQSGMVLLLTNGDEQNREERNSQKLARKRVNSGPKRRRVGENEMLEVGQGEERDELRVIFECFF